MGTSSAGASSLQAERDAFAERLAQAAGATFDLFAIYLGDRLGFYSALAQAGPLTSGSLASRAGVDERYAREWLEQQTVTGVLEVEDGAAGSAQRRYRLPAGHAEVLLDRDSLFYLSPMVRLAVSVTRPIEELMEAYRTGQGVPLSAYGADFREGQAESNRPAYLHYLGAEWFPAIPELHARLMADPPARVADLGCGMGWSSIAMATAYPKVRVDGLDLDEPTIACARHNAREAGLDGRLQFQARDAGDPALANRYDLVTAFECLHDMADPVRALRAMRSLAGDSGFVLIMDEAVADSFDPGAGVTEAIMYGYSILHCLPTGMADQPSAGTGAVMRIGTLERYAQQAGFKGVEVLPVEHSMWRFYRLRQ